MVSHLLWCCFIAFLMVLAMRKTALYQGPVSFPNPSIAALLDEYRFSLMTLNRSPKTISWYLQILRRYLRFLEFNSLHKPIQLLGTQELKAYIAYLQNAIRWADNPNVTKSAGKLSPFSIQGHVRAIKAFWGWLLREGHVEYNRLAKFPLPKVPDCPARVLSTDQITRLLGAIDRLSLKGLRNHTMILLLVDTGLRVSELVNIKLEDIDLEHRLIRVCGKRQKVRSVPISNITKKQLVHYITHARSHICPGNSAYLFPNADGTPISVNCVQQLLHRLALKVGFSNIRCSPHVLRHTFATLSVANGANVFVLKEIMGHSSLITTLKYTHLQPHDLCIHHSGLSPVVNLRTNSVKG